ncbi:MAG: DUF192 domain-containing protein [Patescibacteria group bacterium]
MNLNGVIIIFVIVLAVFFGVIFTQFNQGSKKLEATKVTINEATYTAEIAQTDEQKEIGLSGRDSIADDRAMLFVFEKPGTYQFWMKDMKFPIDIIFINGDKIVSFVENTQPSPNNDNLQRYAPEGTIDKALEVKAGTVQKSGFKKGDTVTIEKK